jgi:hypothetical protein
VSAERRRYTDLMRTLVSIFVVLTLVCVSNAHAQRRRPAARKPAGPAVVVKKEPADVKCPELLGKGVRTGSTFCFVLAGRDPGQGVVVTIPPHRGAATLTFDLHNRHTYSEEEMRAGRGFAKYTAVIGVLTMGGELLSRAAVQSEFRTAGDLYDRITGGAGPGGVKAVAPIGHESVRITVPASVTDVSFLGELLDATTTAGHEIATPGRPVAIVSNVQVEYTPGKKR